MMEALLKGDYERYDECIYQGREAAKELFNCVQKCKEMRLALQDKYGEDGWNKFNEVRIRGRITNLKPMQPGENEIRNALKRGIAFEVDGDVASCVLPWNNTPQAFKRAANGSWYADDGADTDGIAVVLSSFSAGLDAAMARIAEDISIADLKSTFEDARQNRFKEGAAKLLSREKEK